MTMTTAMDNCVKNELLEAFPFTKVELERLLELWNVFSEQENGNFSSLSSWIVGAPTFDDFELDISLLQRVEADILPPNLVGIIVKEAVASVFVLGGTNEDESLQETKTFLEAMATLLGRRGQKSLISLLDRAAKEDSLLWVYRLAIASHILLNGAFPEALDPSNLSTPTSWKFQQDESFVHWATMIAPGASTALSTFMHLSLFTRYHPFRPDIPPLVLPNAGTDDPSALWKYPWDDLSISLALLSPTSLGGDWRRLFSNDVNGNSFRTMQESLLGFQGPTVILIRSSTGDVFGFSTDCPWKSSRKWFGQGSDSFLFTLSPTLAFYPATGEGSHYMYLQLPSIRHKQDLRGLAIGGVASDRPRLHITESLEQCRACPYDVAYTPGPILSDDMQAYFDVDVLEVWATSMEEESFQQAQAGGALYQSIREATRTKVAKIDKVQFVDDFATGVFLNKGFAHRDDVGDRTDSFREFKQHYDNEDEE